MTQSKHSSVKTSISLLFWFDFISVSIRFHWLIFRFFSCINFQCIFQTWFVSVDFQLWLISYVPLILLYKKPKYGVALCLVLMLSGCLASSFIVWWEELPSYPTGREIDIFLFMVYSKRFIPWHFYVNSGFFNYFLGILTAYYCLTQKPIKSQVTNESQTQTLTCLVLSSELDDFSLSLPYFQLVFNQMVVNGNCLDTDTRSYLALSNILAGNSWLAIE